MTAWLLHHAHERQHRGLVNNRMGSSFYRRFAVTICYTLLLGASAAGLGADPALLDLERLRLQREQRLDELRLHLDQERRATLPQDTGRSRIELQPDYGRLRMQRSQEDMQRSIEQQRQSQERLSQQLLHQDQLLQDRRLRQRLGAAPDPVARSLLQAERQRFTREREAQLRQFESQAR